MDIEGTSFGVHFSGLDVLRPLENFGKGSFWIFGILSELFWDNAQAS
jgi:hypothetical protein